MNISSLKITTASSQKIIADLMQRKIELSKEPVNVINTSEMSVALRRKYELYNNIFTDLDDAYGPDHTGLSGRAYKPELEKMLAKYDITRSTMWHIIRIYLQSGRDISHIFANMYPKSRKIKSGGSGSLKGVMEQFFHQIRSAQDPILENRGLIEKRLDSKHHKGSTITLNEYIPLLIGTVLKHDLQYMEGYKLTADMRTQGVTATPLPIWEYGVKKYGSPRPVTNTQHYLYDLMFERKASLSRKGILFDGLYYLNSNDHDLFSEMYNAENKRVPFTIRYDPRSVNNVYYLRDNKLMVATLNPSRGNIDYANLSFAEWAVLRKNEAAQKRQGREYNDQLDANLMTVGQTIAANASKKKKRYSNTSNIINVAIKYCHINK